MIKATKHDSCGIWTHAARASGTWVHPLRPFGQTVNENMTLSLRDLFDLNISLFVASCSRRWFGSPVCFRVCFVFVSSVSFCFVLFHFVSFCFVLFVCLFVCLWPSPPSSLSLLSLAANNPHESCNALTPCQACKTAFQVFLRPAAMQCQALNWLQTTCFRKWPRKKIQLRLGCHFRCFLFHPFLFRIWFELISFQKKAETFEMYLNPILIQPENRTLRNLAQSHRRTRMSR